MTPTPETLMTPAELRHWATAELPPEDDVDGNYKLIGYLRRVCAVAADAWEALIAEVYKTCGETGAREHLDPMQCLSHIAGRLAASEQARQRAERGLWLAVSEWSTWKDVLLSNMKEADWQETTDGLRAALAGEANRKALEMAADMAHGRSLVIEQLTDGIAALRKRLEAAEKARQRALHYLRQIVGAVDGVMADWEQEKSAELVPTTIGQWAEAAIRELAALAGEEKP